MLKSIEQSNQTGFELAVIGMSVRFPGAANIHQYWDNLKNGIESLSFLSNKELEEAGITPGLHQDENYVETAGGVLENLEHFDASFFDYSPTEAIVMNPQMRIFHECAWEALEDAGYEPKAYNGSIGIYAGAYSSFYWQGVTHLSGKCDELGLFDSNYLNDSNFMATRIAYKLGLKGPAFTVQTACSTSLVAIHLACQGLLNGECDMALAGGVTITPGKPGGYMSQEGMIFSPDGHCRAFDARASGTTVGNGAGIVLLKTLEDAIADRDHIYALVKGAAINNDGIRKIGYAAPSMEGQAEVIRTALRLAEAEPESIGYLEAHGTGTLLGDPVEIQGLKLAFKTDKKRYCAIGSVKTNIGHLDAAAGAAGFIKTVLALKHRLIPPSLHFETPNPKIDFDNSPFYVNQTLSKWKNDKYPLRAGVSSFGIGGTNAHVILEEFSEGTRGLAPLTDEEVQCQGRGGVSPPYKSRDYQLILLSARTEFALEQMTQNLVEHFKKNPGINLADSAYTLQIGRKAFKYRRMLVCANANEAVRLLSSKNSAKVKTHYLEQDSPPIVFMFPGLGAQYVNMGRELYEKEPLFRREMDLCFEILEPLTDYDIKEILYPGISLSQVSSVSGGSSKDHMATRTTSHEGCVETPLIGSPRRGVNQSEIAPIVIFIFEYALAKLLMTWGINPYAMIGYSFGEYAAACVSGVFSLKDALKLVVSRGQLLQQLPEGAMLSVPLSREEISPYLNRHTGIFLAIDNGPSCIITGSITAIHAVEKQVKGKKLLCMRVPAARALHSPMMEPILKEYDRLLHTVSLHKPQIPYISNVTGDWQTDQEAADPAYWTRHLREPVQFASGMKTLLKETGTIFLEIGPGRDISTLALRHLEGDSNAKHRVLNLVKPPHQDISDVYFLLNRVGRLWLYGQSIHWQEIHGEEKNRRGRVPLPTYPFEQQPFTIDSHNIAAGINMLEQTTPLRRKKNIDNWFYIPSWKRYPIPARQTGEIPANLCWLVFIDGCGLGAQLVKQLEQKKQAVITVKTGNAYKKENHNQFTINPREDNHYHTLFKELRRRELEPDRIVHLWCVTPDRSDCELLDIEHVLGIQDLGYYSLLTTARAIGKLGITKDIQLTVVTNNLQEVTGNDGLNPGKATVIGPVKVIPTEYANIKCRGIDVVLPSAAPGTGTGQRQKLAGRLWEELESGSVESAAAYRGDYRWIKTFAPIRFKEPEKKHLPLKQSGVYLITGGTGGIGLELAQYLAKEFQAQLVLTGRTELPPKNQWQQWLEQPGKDQNLKRKIQKIKELEECGAKVLVCCADVSNPQQMQKIIARAQEQFHAIDGVIHCAGLADGEMIRRRTREKSAQIFKSKIQGTLVLDRLLQLMKKKPRFFLLCSSVTSVLPVMGQAGYSAANAFLDAYAQYRNTPGSDSNHMFTVSVNWDRWRNTGIANILETRHKELTGKNLAGGITGREGVETFCRILANTQSQVVVSPHDIGILFEKTHLVKAPSFIEGLKETVVPGKALPRPQLDSEYTPPGNKTEEILANLWAAFFGYEKIGTRDDFFELGGDSLRAMVIASKIHKELNIEVPFQEIFNRPTIEALVQYIEQITEKTAYVSIETAEEKEYYSLAFAQKRLYILQRMEPANISYNQSNVLELEGQPGKDRLERAFKKLLQRHESLRTSFEIIKGEPVQRIQAGVDFEIEYYDLNRTRVEAKVKVEEGEGTRGLAPLPKEPATRNPQPATALISSFIRPFDLAQAPLLRVGLIKLPHTPTALRGHPSQEGREHKYLLMVDMHHIIADGISIGILKEDFMSLYGDEELPALRIRFRDFSEWQKTPREKQSAQGPGAFWLKEYAGEIPVLNLPTDNPRPGIQEFKGNAVVFEIHREQLQAIKARAKNSEATLYMFLLSIYIIMLAKLAGQEDIVVGTPTAGRRHPDLQPVIGMFANTLALRNYPVGEKTFQEFFAEVKERTLQALENQDYPFEDLVEQAAVRRDFSRNPIFDVMFILQNMETKELETPGLKLKPYEYEYNVAKFDLTLTGVETGSGLLFTFEYSTSLFKEATIGRFIRYFKIILSKVLENHEIKLGEIEIIPGEEKKELLYDFNNTYTDYPGNKTVHQLFAEQVEKTPDHVALVGSYEKIEGTRGLAPLPTPISIAYRELNEKSHQLACFLIGKGVNPGTIVGILLERTPQMLIGLLGILKAGAAYLPLDPEYPEARIKYIIEKSSITLLLTRENLIRKYEEAVFEGEIIDIFARDLYREPGGEGRSRPGRRGFHTDPAYVIYTSGSTGNPKGVIVHHKNAVNFIIGMTSVIDFSPGKTILALTTISFDIFLLETLLPVTRGLKVVIAAEGEQNDPQLLKDVILNHRVEMIQATPSRLQLLLSLQDDLRCLTGVKELMVGGEAFPPPLFESVKTHFQGKIYNLYGPTETTVWSTIKDLSHSQSHEITIGRPIVNTQVYIVSTAMRVQPLGIAGELLIGGDGVAMGYLDNVELTAEKFESAVISHSSLVIGNLKRAVNSHSSLVISSSLKTKNRSSKLFPNDQCPMTNDRLYRTGDLARWLPNGELEFLGRLDHQVKIRGFRVELEEIEEQLVKHADIKEAVVIVKTNQKKDKYLAAYIIPEPAAKEKGTGPGVELIIEHLSQQLPHYMIPSYFVSLENIPLTPNGKIDRKSLPTPEESRLKPAAAYVKPSTEVEKIIADIWKQELELEKVGVNDNIFSLGATSLDLVKVNQKLKESLGRNIPMVALFQYRTIGSFIRYINQAKGDSLPISPAKVRSNALKRGERDKLVRIQNEKKEKPVTASTEEPVTALEIAVIGVAGRFPGAKNVREFWENLKNGIDSISLLSNQELEKEGVSSELLQNPTYVKARGILEDIEYFDSRFFGYTPGEAELMDPQVRIFHESAWEALEDAGYDTQSYDGLIGLFAGASYNYYWEWLSKVSGKIDDVGMWTAVQLMDKDFLTMRVSYALNLNGPSFSMYTACSTSLVAVHLACQAILGDDCDMALAGGITILLPQKIGYIYQEGMIMSPDGRCKAFDASANGIVSGSGVGVVLLKRLENAIAYRDHIYAVIKGTAINNDGIRKTGFTAPSIEGQVEVIRTAQQISHVEPESISYIETHGTGTPLGDPMEVEALRQAFAAQKKQFCAIGSVKTNIGHLDAAAGIAGFIKTILALNHRLIPPSLHFKTSNPEIDFENSPFYVNTRLKEWKNDPYPLRAGVSSFGIGGTNAHVILEEFPEGTRGLSRDYQLILLSAKTESALEKMTQNLAKHFNKNPGINLADAAHTLQIGRRAFKYRRMLVCANGNEAVRLLSSRDSVKVKTHYLEQDSPPIVFMFPGLGAQYVNMGRELYKKEPLFQREMDRCFEILESLIDCDLKEILYPSSVSSVTSVAKKINQTEIAQPVLFAFEYSLARLLIQWGIKPGAMIGYSFGEYAAACTAGVFSLEDALDLVVTRARLLQQLPAGGMLSVPLPLKELEPILGGKLAIAIDNGPSCVVSGTLPALEALENQLKKKKYLSIPMQIPRALHSPMTEPILKQFEEKISQFTLKTPRIPFISNVTGTWIANEEAAAPGYWTKHLRQTVRYAQGMRELLRQANWVFVEVGPGKDLSTLALRYMDVDGEQQGEPQPVNLVRPPHREISDVYFLLNRIGMLWLYRQEINWKEFYAGEKRHHIPLPTYPFETQPFRLDQTLLRETPVTGEPRIRKKTDQADWFYIPQWRRCSPPTPTPGQAGKQTRWLVFINQNSLAAGLVERLKQDKQIVITVKPGTAFTGEGDGCYRVNPQQSEDYRALFRELQQLNMIPDTIVHTWSITGKASREIGPRQIEAAREKGFYSLIYMAQALGKAKMAKEIRIGVLSDHLQEVNGKESLSPEKATILGPVKVIPQEYPFLTCRTIDIVCPESGSRQEKIAIEQLLAELKGNAVDPVTAYRGNYRWVQTFESVRWQKIETPGAVPRLKKGGVYLITGGLGNIGTLLAAYLLETLEAKLILIGRTPLPDKKNQDQWLKTHGQDDGISRKILKVRELEKMGGQVLVFAVDVSDEKGMREAIRQAEDRFGSINGVIHAAGDPGESLLSPVESFENTACHRQFIPKIYGLLVLEQVLKNKPLDFCLLTSSLSSVLGGLGFSAYSAANSFMDLFVRWHNRKSSQQWISVNWADWGFSKANDTPGPQPAKPGSTVAELRITPGEGIQTFERILYYCQSHQVVVSSGDLTARINQWVMLESLRKQDNRKIKNKKQASLLRNRPGLLSPYEAPRTPLEKDIAEIWQELFGFVLGVEDDFFELGGDSLKALIILPRIHKKSDVEIPIAEFFKRPTIRKLSEYIAGAERRLYYSIEPKEKKEYYALSSAQKRLFILQQMAPTSTAYNESLREVFEGNLAKTELEEIFWKLIKKHESLRTSFKLLQGEPVQRIYDEVDFKIEYDDLYRTQVEVKEPAAGRRQPTAALISSFIRPFDLSKPPLFRVGLFCTPRPDPLGHLPQEGNSRDNYILVVDIHHIIADGISTGILIKEMMALYQGVPLPELRIQYKDFSEWQNSDQQRKVIEKQGEYWLEIFHGKIPELSLPIDYERPGNRSFEGTSRGFQIREQESQALRDLASEQEATLFMILLALFNILLAKASGQEDIVIGTPVAGRSHPDVELEIGMFLNTLALRNYPEAEKTFREFLREIKTRTLQAFENQAYHFEDLVDRVISTRDPGRNPLFDVMLMFQGQGEMPRDIPTVEIPELKLKPYSQENKTSKFDLTLWAYEFAPTGTLSFAFEYCTKLFKEETIEIFIDSFKAIISSVLADPDAPLSEIEITSTAERTEKLSQLTDDLTLE